MKISPPVKVGILTILSIVILVFGVMWLKGRSISAGERIEVKFQDVDGMRPGSAVQMMGIRIGQVEEVIPELNKDTSFVKVRFVITEPGVSVPTASTISIQQSGIIGEKYLEITPPQIQTVYLPDRIGAKGSLKYGSPLELLVNGNYTNIGQVKTFDVVDSRTLEPSLQQKLKAHFAYKIGYTVNMPGITVPEDVTGKIKSTGNFMNKYKLILTPPSNFIVQLPEPDQKYTIIEPMRLKTFFDLQLKSAAELEKTNEKVNAILTDESIADLKSTLKNAKLLTAKATITLDQATQLLSSSKQDFNTLVTLASSLSSKMIVLSDNVNGIIGDPKLKKNLIATTGSIESSTRQISEILSDPKIREIFNSVNTTTKDISEITGSINSMTKEPAFKGKLENTITNLNVSLDKLSKTLDTVNSLTSDEKVKLKGIIQESSETSQNLKKFSDKLNKRFLLFRLMF